MGEYVGCVRVFIGFGSRLIRAVWRSRVESIRLKRGRNSRTEGKGELFVNIEPNKETRKDEEGRKSQMKEGETARNRSVKGDDESVKKGGQNKEGIGRKKRNALKLLFPRIKEGPIELPLVRAELLQITTSCSGLSDPYIHPCVRSLIHSSVRY